MERMVLIKEYPTYKLMRLNKKYYAVFEESFFIKSYGEIPSDAIQFNYEGINYVSIKTFHPAIHP